MARTIKIDDMTNAIMKELKQYSEELNEEIKVDTKKVAQEAVKQLKSTSPKRSGAYAKSWTQKESVKGEHVSKRVIYNKDHYQLTHLLENGHVKIKNGKAAGRVDGISHIKPAEEKAIKNLEEKIIKSIKKV